MKENLFANSKQTLVRLLDRGKNGPSGVIG